MRKRSLKELQILIDAAHGANRYRIVARADGGRNKAKIKCRAHGTYIGAIPTKNVSCPTCKQEQYGKVRIDNRFKKFKKAIKQFPELSYKEGYAGAKVRCTIHCTLHGDQLIYPGRVFRKLHPCPSCHKEQNRAATEDKQKAIFLKACASFPNFKFGKFAYYDRNFKKKIKVKCLKHGTVFEIAHYAVSNRTELACPTCIGEKHSHRLTKTHEEVEEQLRKIHKGKVALLDPYSGTRQHHRFHCLVCDYVWSALPDSLTRAKPSGCPYCGKTVSAGECELFEWVKRRCPDARQSVREVFSAKLGYRFEWDIYVPSLKIAIEYNGLYHHSFPRKPKYYHLEKTQRSAEAGVRLLHVYEDDWMHRRPVVLKTLTYLLGLEKKRAFARKLRLVKKARVDEHVRRFYDKNHMLGAPTRGVTYALLDGNTPKALMTFSPVQSVRGHSANTTFELIRFACVGQVVGGASRLFTAFLRDTPHASRVISYSDADMFDGGLYKTLGFLAQRSVRPDYTTVWKGRRRHKSYTRRQNLAKLLGPSFNPEESEMENLIRNKVLIVFNSGRLKWVWEKQ